MRGWRFLSLSAVLLGSLLLPSSHAFAQVLDRRPWQESSGPAHELLRFGVMGQIAHPGVYQFSTAAVTLNELVRQAGGLATTASGNIRIIRNGRPVLEAFYSADNTLDLLPGDLVIADARHGRRAPLEAGSGTRDARSAIQVAFVNLIDRPVVLKIDAQSATLAGIVRNLRQSQTILSSVRVISRMPVANATSPRRYHEPLPSETVLVFDPTLIEPDILPELGTVHVVAPEPARAHQNSSQHYPPGEAAQADNTARQNQVPPTSGIQTGRPADSSTQTSSVPSDLPSLPTPLSVRPVTTTTRPRTLTSRPPEDYPTSREPNLTFADTREPTVPDHTTQVAERHYSADGQEIVIPEYHSGHTHRDAPPAGSRDATTPAAKPTTVETDDPSSNAQDTERSAGSSWGWLWSLFGLAGLAMTALLGVRWWNHRKGNVGSDSTPTAGSSTGSLATAANQSRKTRVVGSADDELAGDDMIDGLQSEGELIIGEPSTFLTAMINNELPLEEEPLELLHTIQFYGRPTEPNRLRADAAHPAPRPHLLTRNAAETSATNERSAAVHDGIPSTPRSVPQDAVETGRVEVVPVEADGVETDVAEADSIETGPDAADKGETVAADLGPADADETMNSRQRSARPAPEPHNPKTPPSVDPVEVTPKVTGRRVSNVTETRVDVSHGAMSSHPSPARTSTVRETELESEPGRELKEVNESEKPARSSVSGSLGLLDRVLREVHGGDR